MKKRKRMEVMLKYLSALDYSSVDSTATFTASSKNYCCSEKNELLSCSNVIVRSGINTKFQK